MKRFLATACAVGAAFSLTGCLNTSESAPTTVQGVMDFFEKEEVNCFTDMTMDFWGAKIVSTSEIDYSKSKTEVTTTYAGVSSTEVNFMEIKGDKQTTYTQDASGNWLAESVDYENSESESFFEEITATDFVKQENGDWLYSNDVSDPYYGDYTETITMIFTDGAFEVIFSTTYVDEGVSVTTDDLIIKCYAFGKASVTLPTVA
ncbi:MAG: hypothetical protein R3Y60_02335 [bacterium]